MNFGIDPTIYAWVVLPILVFFARIIDVSIGTLRIIFVSRGKRNLAPILGFFEVLVWIVVVAQIVNNLQAWVSYVAYAAGFATGTYIGLTLENRLALGMMAVRTISPNAHMFVQKLREAGYGVTELKGEGTTGQVNVVYTVIPRKNLDDVIHIIRSATPKAFVSVEEIQSAREGIFPSGKTRGLWDMLSLKAKK